jgi:hypothetical protein
VGFTLGGRSWHAVTTMASHPLKIVEVEQAGDTLTVVFNDGRTVTYSISMLDSEFEEIQCSLGEEPVAANPAHGTKRQANKLPKSKRPGSQAHPLRPWRAAKAS